MKTITKISKACFLVMLSLVVTTSCSSDDEGSSSGSDFMRANVDGSSFQASTSPANLMSASKNATGSFIVLTAQGSNNSGDAINFSIIDYTGEGTYSTGMASGSQNLIQFLRVSPFGGWVSSGVSDHSGTIVVTSDNGQRVQGTFEFVGLNSSDSSTMSITNGEFSIQFQ